MPLPHSRRAQNESSKDYPLVKQRLPKVWHKAEELPTDESIGSSFDILVETSAGDLIEIQSIYDGEGFVCDGSFPGIPLSGRIYLVPTFFRLIEKNNDEDDSTHQPTRHP